MTNEATAPGPQPVTAALWLARLFGALFVALSIISTFQVASRLGKSEAWFRRHREYLEHLGFPNRDDDLDGWDGDAINRWLDHRSGIRNRAPGRSEQGQDWLDRVGKGRNPLRTGGEE